MTLLAIDVGNTQTVVGTFVGDDLAAHWRMATNPDRTADEHAMLIKQFISDVTKVAPIDGVCICSVVPRVTSSLSHMSAQYFDQDALIVGPDTQTPIKNMLDTPRELGADIIANAVAAHHMFSGNTITVDFGTATTVDAVTAQGEFLGGVIMPGIGISLDALFERAAGLRRVDIKAPKNVIGRTTAEAIQSGVLYGYAGQADAIVEKFRAEVGNATVIATGGLSDLIVPYSATVEIHEPWLTLHGLRLIHAQLSAGA